MSNVRLRRLTADYQKLAEYARLHPRITLIQAEGDPPERYQLQYRIKSLRSVNGELAPVKDHTVEIVLPRNYPRTPPQCRMLTPVFHPNIAPHAICVGDHWSAGESLQSIVTRIGEMLAYQSYNVKSPLNGEAARWVEENKDQLPLDRVSLLVDEASKEEEEPIIARTVNRPGMGSKPSPSPRFAEPAPSGLAEPIILEPAPETFQTQCPACQASYTVKTNLMGRKVRCKKCQSVFEIQ
jgi:predicted Zn finger-like uncharacterized protein